MAAKVDKLSLDGCSFWQALVVPSKAPLDENQTHVNSLIAQAACGARVRIDLF
jgi:hypothetical protein